MGEKKKRKRENRSRLRKKKVEEVPEIPKSATNLKKTNIKKMGPKSSCSMESGEFPPKIREFIRAVKTEQAGWKEELKAWGSSSVV